MYRTAALETAAAANCDQPPPANTQHCFRIFVERGRQCAARLYRIFPYPPTTGIDKKAECGLIACCAQFSPALLLGLTCLKLDINIICGSKPGGGRARSKPELELKLIHGAREVRGGAAAPRPQPGSQPTIKFVILR